MKQLVMWRQILMVLCVICICLTILDVRVWAEHPTARSVYVTVTDAEGGMLLCHVPVNLTDEDRDGKLTVSDALWAAHEEKYPGGADAGYEVEKAKNAGSILIRFWGEDEDVSDWDVAVNNDPRKTLDTRVEAGDHIQVFRMHTAQGQENVYTYFSVCTVTVRNSQSVKSDLNITARYLTYGDDQLESVMPLEGVVITVNGDRTDAVTDTRGRAALDISDWESGTYVISANGGNVTMVPPVGIAQVPEVVEPSDHRELVWVGVMILATATVWMAMYAIKRRGRGK